MFRRHFLRGAGGVAVALPFLESVRSRHASAAGDQPRRFVAFFECNGVDMTRFFPNSAYGALTSASLVGTALEPLSEYVDRMLVPRGIHMVPRGFGRDPSAGDDHAKGMGCKLTAQPLLAGTTYAAGISVDQEIANHLNPSGRPALNLHVGYRSTSHLGHCSYFGSEQPAIGENNPWLAYQDFMGMSNLDQGQIDRLVSRRESVLDLVERDFGRLTSGGLGQADLQKLDMHLTAIRELETSMEEAGLVSCNLSAPVEAELQSLDPNTIGYDSEYKRIGRMQMDILALALACGSTSAATLQWGSGAGGPIFSWDGMSHQYNHHKLSHGNTADDCSGSSVAGYEDMLFGIDRWYAGELAYLLEVLDAYDEGGSSVLDNSCVVWMNELSDGRGHNFMDLPYVMMGSCGGYFRMGEYIKVTAQGGTMNDADAPHNKLLTTILNAVGVQAPGGGPVLDFGDPAFGEPGEFEMLKA